MKRYIAAFVSCVLFSAALYALPASAASAHNSQRGSLGNSSDNAGPSGMTMRMKGTSGHRRHHSRHRM